MKSQPVQSLSEDLYTALTEGVPIAPITPRYPELGIEDAYAVSLKVLERRVGSGEIEIGKKIGLTTPAVREMLGIDEPDFGFLTNAMQVDNGGTVPLGKGLLAPLIEAEIAFVLRDDLPVTGVTEEQVLASTAYITPCLEVVGTSFTTAKIGIVDTVADNASADRFVLGEAKTDPRAIDLAAVRCVMKCNGSPLSEGLGSDVMGTPLASVAWLANRLGSFGKKMSKGDIVLSGSLVPMAPVAVGDQYVADFQGLGDVSVSFT